MQCQAFFGVGSSLYYFLQDHLGSTSLTLDSSGAKVAETLYDCVGQALLSMVEYPHQPPLYRANSGFCYRLHAVVFL